MITKLYFGTNAAVVESARHEICSEMIDIFIDISFLYTPEKVTRDLLQKNEENTSKAIIKLNIKENPHILLLKCVDKFLAVVCIIKEPHYDRPYLIDYNIDVFKRGMSNMLQATSTSVIKF